MQETKNTEPEISVIIPVYNVEKYLQDCIDSLLEQTFESIELIFVDDASPDSSGQILDRNAERYPEKIRVIHLPENRHQGGARNAGIEAARGKYIGFVDSDDIVLPGMFDILYKSVTESDSDVSFILMSKVRHDITYASIKKSNFEGLSLKSDIEVTEEYRRYNTIDSLTEDDRNFLYVLGFTGGLVTGLWKKSVIIDSGVHFPEKIFFEDNYWSSLIIPYLTRVRFNDTVQYLYRSNPQSTTHRRNDLQSKKDRIISEKAAITEMKMRGFFDTYRSGMEFGRISVFARNTFRATMYYNRGYSTIKKFLFQVMEDFTSEFPDWQSNIYYIERTDTATKKMDAKIINCSRGFYFISYFGGMFLNFKPVKALYDGAIKLFNKISKK